MTNQQNGTELRAVRQVSTGIVHLDTNRTKTLCGMVIGLMHQLEVVPLTERADVSKLCSRCLHNATVQRRRKERDALSGVANIIRKAELAAYNSKLERWNAAAASWQTGAKE